MMNHSELDNLMLSFRDAIKNSKTSMLSGKLSNKNIASYTFENIRIPGCLDNSTFKNCQFNNVNFKGGYFASCKFEDCEFRECNFRKVQFMVVELLGTKIQSSNLTAAEFNSGVINNCAYESCCFSNSDIIDSKVFDSIFKGYYYEKGSDLLLYRNRTRNIIVEMEPLDLETLAEKNMH